MLFSNKRQWPLLRIIVKNALTILPPEHKDFGFPEAACGVMKVKVTPADRYDKNKFNKYHSFCSLSNDKFSIFLNQKIYLLLVNTVN